MSIEVRSNDKAADDAVNGAKAVDETKPDTTSEGGVADLSTPAQKDGDEPDTSAEKDAASGAVESEESDSHEKTESKEQESEGSDSDNPPNKKKGGFQRRIDKLNSKITEREREIEYWKNQALKTAGLSGDSPKVETKPQTQEPQGKPKAEDFETHAEFVEALTDWKTDQKLKAKDEAESRSRLETEQQRVMREYNDRAKEFAEKTDDFNEVLEEVNDVPLSTAVKELILSSENGPEIAYALAKNKDEFKRVNSLSPLAAAREIGKLESRLSKPSSEAKQPKITKAPPPIAPVGSGGKGSATKSIDDPTLSQADYERLRREQMKKRRQA